MLPCVHIFGSTSSARAAPATDACAPPSIPHNGRCLWLLTYTSGTHALFTSQYGANSTNVRVGFCANSTDSSSFSPSRSTTRIVSTFASACFAENTLLASCSPSGSPLSTTFRSACGS